MTCFKLYMEDIGMTCKVINITMLEQQIPLFFFFKYSGISLASCSFTVEDSSRLTLFAP